MATQTGEVGIKGEEIGKETEGVIIKGITITKTEGTIMDITVIGTINKGKVEEDIKIKTHSTGDTGIITLGRVKIL